MQEETKGRKLKSKVWDEFTKYKGEDGMEWAICNVCEKELDGSSKRGTTHLKNHLESKKCRAKRKADNMNIDGDQDKSIKSRDLLAGDLIKQIFNAEGNTIAEDDIRSLNSRKVEILQVYQEEKIKLGQFLNKLLCHFSLEKYWVEGDYFLLRLHYIDDDWCQQSKIITLLQYTDLESFIEAVKRTCLDWKIDGNICCVLDFGRLKDNDDNQIGKTNGWFSQRSSLPFGGFLRDVNDLLSDADILFLESYPIDGIRRCVDYGYKTTPLNKLKLRIAASIANSKGKKAIFEDVPLLQNRFNYLEIGVGLREAFCEVEKIDPYFRSIHLSKEKWDEATATFEHLKAFNEHCWYGTKNINIIPTVDFPKLAYMHKILAVPCNRSEDCRVCKNELLKKFVDTYWTKYYLVIVVAIILDPRLKMDSVQLCYKEIYGSADADGYLEKITEYFRDVFAKYYGSSKPYRMLDIMGRPCCTTLSEIDRYLQDLKVPTVVAENFDILAWWRGSAPFFPTLARMARDYLAITGRKTVDRTLKDEIRTIINSEIDGEIVPALACLKGWYCKDPKTK